jgi:hypothetical protein
MHSKRRDCAGGEASDGLDQRGREARMVFGHEGNFLCIMLEFGLRRKKRRKAWRRFGCFKIFWNFAEAEELQSLAPPVHLDGKMVCFRRKNVRRLWKWCLQVVIALNYCAMIRL